MKKIIYFSLALLSLFFTSCEEDPITPTPHPIEGSWSLIIENLGFGPTYYYDLNQVICDFNDNNQFELIIDESVGSLTGEISFHANGIYEYLIDENRITISGREHIFWITQDTLMIDYEISSDGYLLKLVRN